MELVNYTLEWVWEVLDEVLNEREDICKCEKCRYDMACMALNRLRSNYAVSESGKIITKTKMLSVQEKTNVLTEVLKAVEAVSKNPHHNNGSQGV
mgnify:CR=1 FL=1